MLTLTIVIPQQDIMQFFIQWQRYRKFWWSSITTTPSLFTLNDIKHEENLADVEIVAQFPWSKQPVENVTITTDVAIQKGTSLLTCTMSLENALFTLLMDGLNNQNKDEYLRLHRTMAPYTFSFALNYEESKKHHLLQDLATLLYSKLKAKKISTWLPSWSLSLESQVKENLQLGVTYTAILDENTLTNGIFHLMNSNTMLQEQVHVADFDSYAALLSGKKNINSKNRSHL